MPVDDMPEPADAPTADDLDSAYQQGVDAGVDGQKWVRSALAVLTADIDPDGPGTLTSEAVRQMRTEAARMIARVFRGVLADAD